jgi:MFS family permease
VTTAPPPAAGAQRWILSLALMVSLVVGFYDRNNLTLALTDVARDLGWTEAETAARGGMLMSAFYMTYGVTNMVLSPVANRRLGVRRSLLLMVVAVSIVTALTPLAGRALGLFLAMRLLLGICEGVHYPLMATVTRRWFPFHERSRGTALYLSGAAVSGVTAPLLLIPLKERLGWRGMFVALALLGAGITLPALHRWVHDAPSAHPRVSEAERRYVEHHVPPESGAAALDLASIRRLFETPGFPVALVAGVLGAMAGIGLMSWLPAYLEKARGLTPDELAPALSAGFGCLAAGIAFFAWISDRSRRRIRLTGLSVLAGALCACAVAVVPGKAAMVGCLCLAMFLLGACAANEWAVMQRVLPEDRMALGSGIYNGTTTLVGGGLGPAMIGGIISLTGRYSSGMMVLGIVCVSTGAAYLWLGSKVRY